MSFHHIVHTKFWLYTPITSELFSVEADIDTDTLCVCAMCAVEYDNNGFVRFVEIGLHRPNQHRIHVILITLMKRMRLHAFRVSGSVWHACMGYVSMKPIKVSRTCNNSVETFSGSWKDFMWKKERIFRLFCQFVRSVSCRSSFHTVFCVRRIFTYHMTTRCIVCTINCLCAVQRAVSVCVCAQCVSLSMWKPTTPPENPFAHYHHSHVS